MRILDMAMLVPALVFSAFSAHATDGVIEINQARALSGGVTPGDTPGFPVTLSAPGSYVLTGNLTVSSTTDHALDVTTDGVSIDLHGFTIQGPVSCTGLGSTLTCAPAATGAGIDGYPHRRLRIGHGTVRGFGGAGISAGPQSHIDSLEADSNGATGIEVGESSEVSHSIAYQNRGFGITSGFASVMHHNVAKSNSGAGIEGGSGSSIVASTARDNGYIGIIGGANSVVRDCSALENESTGIHVGYGALVSDCAAMDNGGNGIEVGYGSTAQRNTVRLNSEFGLGVESSAAYRENVISSNKSGTVTGAGINTGDNLCNGSTSCP